jgi:hypothetical protein
MAGSYSANKNRPMMITIIIIGVAEGRPGLLLCVILVSYVRRRVSMCPFRYNLMINLRSLRAARYGLKLFPCIRRSLCRGNVDCGSYGTVVQRLMTVNLKYSWKLLVQITDLVLSGLSDKPHFAFAQILSRKGIRVY